jgi:Staphylococcal nuclease homologue
LINRLFSPTVKMGQKRYYGTRFVMRLDPQTREKLEHFSDHFDRPVAEVIRQGYGLAYTQFPFTYLEQFRRLEREAREAQRGLWRSR